MFNDASQFIQGVSATVLDIAATDEIELTATLIDVVGNFAISGTVVGASTIQGTTITATTAFVPDAQDGAALGTTSLQFSDLFLADGAVLGFGDNNEVTLTHVHDTGILLNSTMAIQFNDASQFINAPSNAILDINATDEIELNATLVDVNANLDVSGTIVGASTISGTSITASTSFLPDAQDGAALGTTSLQFSDLFLADGAVIGFGDNNEVTLTHVHDTGILLNSTNVIQFNDASQNIGAPSNAILDINATDEIELNATLVDINANVEISGNLTVSGTTTQVNTVTMNAANAIVLEGATADDHETTLTLVDPTADRTITLPNESGTVHTSGGNTTHTAIVIADGANIGSVSDTNAIGISSGGVVSITATTANTIATDGALTVAGGAGIAADVTIGDDLRMLSDASIISFGTNSDITVTHVHDTGLTITNVIADTDNRPIRFQLKSEEDAIVADDVIATIEFAAGDSDGTDGAVVAAGIHAIAEDTFSASANATKLVFTTGVSETAAVGATAKMTLSSAGLLTIADDLIIKNAGTIGTAADADLLTMGNGNLTVAGTVTATAGATLLIKNAAGSTLKTIKGMT